MKFTILITSIKRLPSKGCIIRLVTLDGALQSTENVVLSYDVTLASIISDVIFGDDIFRTLERKANLIIQPWTVSSF